jgi:hypothetical protein
MTDEPKTDMISAGQEAKMVIGQVVEDVLKKTGRANLPYPTAADNFSCMWCLPHPALGSVLGLLPGRRNMDYAAAMCTCAHLSTVVPLLPLLPCPPAGLSPTDIDILITNCSIYCPTPSIASMVINQFKMREDIEAW